MKIFRIISGTLFFGSIMILLACQPTQVKENKNTGETSKQDTVKSVKVIDDIPYRSGNSESWRLDLAMPENFGEKPMPAIVLVHGGGWLFGSKQEAVFRSLLLDYAFKGYVTISVNYRFDKEARFPACVEDVKCAVRWLRAHAKEYNVDSDRIGAYGHSAGAHLAVMLAVCPPSAGLEGDGGWNEFSSKVNAVVGGSTPTEPDERLISMKWDNPAWWPINYASAEIPSMLIIQGVEDPIVKVFRVDKFVDLLKKAGVKDLSYLRVDGAKHDVSYSQNLDVTKPAMDEFFAKNLRKK